MDERYTRTMLINSEEILSIRGPCLSIDTKKRMKASENIGGYEIFKLRCFIIHSRDI